MPRHISPLCSNGRRMLAAVSLALVGSLVACSDDDGALVGLEADADDSGTATQEQPTELDAGLIGAGTLTITLDDGTVFPFSGDCEISVNPPQTTYWFSLEAPEGELAGARHTVNQDVGAPTSVQFTDEELRRYFVSSFSNTIVDGTNWSSEIVAESDIDGERFSAPGRVESTCT